LAKEFWEKNAEFFPNAARCEIAPLFHRSRTERRCGLVRLVSA